MSAPRNLTASARVYAELKARLMQDEGLAEDEQTLTDTLDGATDLHEQIAACAREARAKEAMADGLGTIMSDMASRKVRLSAGAERLRRHITWAMNESGLPKVTLPDLTLSVRDGKPSVNVTADPYDLPADYQTWAVKPNNAAIRDALARGETLPFATLGNAAPVLTIRSK